jgi:transposase
MEPKQYFMTPQSPEQKHYDALRAYYLDEMPAKEVATQFGYTSAYFKKLRSDFRQKLKEEQNPFFLPKKTGPKGRNTSQTTIDLIVRLRKNNYSIQDIRVALSAQNISVGLNTIDQILKEEGFSPLPRRTQQERRTIPQPHTLNPPKCQALPAQDETLYTEHGALARSYFGP